MKQHTCSLSSLAKKRPIAAIGVAGKLEGVFGGTILGGTRGLLQLSLRNPKMHVDLRAQNIHN
jgi:hypothetical protein